MPSGMPTAYASARTFESRRAGEWENRSLRAARTRRAQACSARRVTGGIRDGCTGHAAAASHRRRAGGMRAGIGLEYMLSRDFCFARSGLDLHLAAAHETGHHRLVALLVDNKKRSPSVGRQGLRNRLHPRARNTRRRNYNRASGVMRGGTPCVQKHARRAAPPEPPSVTLAKKSSCKKLLSNARQTRDACAVTASATSGATPDTRLASVVATVLA